MKKILKTLFAGAALMVPVLISVAGISCKASPDGAEIQDNSADMPKLISYSLEDENTLLMSFSAPVTVKDTKLEALESGTLTEASVVSESAVGLAETPAEESYKVKVVFDDTECGKNYILHGVAESTQGNSLSFSVEFPGFNARIPAVLLNEVRTEYSKTKTKTSVEFVELFVLSEGNTAGLELTVAGDGIEKNYMFPPAEVSAGEYLVVHFRSLEDGCVDETGENTAASTAEGSCDTARDFWVQGSTARIGKTDVIVLRNRSGGKILDAVLFRESEKTAWSKELQKTEAAAAIESAVWLCADKAQDSFASAVCADGLTATRTLSRQNTEQIAAKFLAALPDNSASVYPAQASMQDWIVVATNGATPGAANSNKAFEKN
ncbi:MAG: hypothetical protein NC041_05980 [Bacteroides sp.]|nr:hypothetical protein [Prevotella sp.]MCM1407505.1 hypothetical protein [Treponema brennaborense]MCM1469995.1 hypothetical protein [Bacteroides sp.]